MSEEVGPASGRAGSPKDSGDDAAGTDWPLVHAIVRSFLVCGETQRLYPEGHQRTGLALKNVLERIHDYYGKCSRTFVFVPEMAIDLQASESSQAATDLSTFATLCRGRLIRSLVIHPEVNCEELQSFILFLQTAPDEQHESEHREPRFENTDSDACKWDHITIEFFQEGKEDDGYRFTATGDQVFPSSAGEGHKTNLIPEHFPPAFRNSLLLVFADPSVQDSLEKIESKLSGWKPADGSSTSKPTREVDLIEHLLASLFTDPSKYIDTPHDVLLKKIRDFLSFLERIAARVPLVRDGKKELGVEEVRELLEGAVGLHSWNQPGLPEIFQRASSLKALFNGPETLVEPDPSGGEAVFPQGNVPVARSEPVRASRPTPSTAAGEARDGSDEQNNSDAKLAGHDDRWVTRIPREEWVAQLEETDYGLEVLRIQGELLASDCTDESYLQRRSRFLESFTAREWKAPALFASELDVIGGVIRHREPSESLGLIGDVLSRQESQKTVDSYFLHRVRGGTSVSSLRPLFYRLAMQDSTRPAQILTSLWKASRRDDRDVFLDEVFNLEPDPHALASWGINFPRAFSAPRSIARLEELPMDILKMILAEIISREERPPSEALDPELVVLRAGARKGESEQLFILGLRKGAPRVKAEVLTLLDRCSTGEMFVFLRHMLDTQNQASTPNLEEIRLALTALLRSPLPQAQEFLKRIGSERQILRHTFCREIREILDLLCKVEGPVA